MHCGQCGAEIPEGSKFCPSCGAATGTSSSPAAGGKAPPKKTNWVGTLALIAIVLFALAMCGKGGPSGSADDQAALSSRPTIEVTAPELYAAYDANEAAAQQQYGSSNLVVSGTVGGVNLDLTDNPIVLLQASNPYLSVHANLTEEAQPRAASLSKGQKVTLRCSGVSEVIGTPMLKDCSF